MRYVLDTNILLHAVRESQTWEYVNMEFKPFDYPENQAYICFATLGEILSIATQLG